MVDAQEIDSGDKKQNGDVDMSSKNTTCSWSNKNRFHFSAMILGVPQPKTLCISASADENSGQQVGHFHIAAYPVVVKTAIATSKNIVCRNEDELSAAVAQLSGQDYQVQEWLEGYEFFELDYSLGKIEVRREGVHETVAPSNPVYQKIRGVTKRLIDLLVAWGYQQFKLLVACGQQANYPLECRL